MLSQKKLPEELYNFFRDSQVFKVRKLVNGDLHQLAIAARENLVMFQGGLDIATFAKQRLLITHTHISLAELSTVIFGRCLPKN